MVETLRERLELAALAAGVKVHGPLGDDEQFTALYASVNEWSHPETWNPEVNAGQALELLVMTGFDVRQFGGEVPTITVTDGEIRRSELAKNDRFGKLMRLITQAAADRGRKMRDAKP